MTLGFGEIIPQVVRNSDDFFGTGFNLTNGPNGLTPIDPLGFGAFLHGILPFLPESAFTADNPDWMYYWVGLGLVGLTLVCSIMLRDSRLGRAWVAIREDEIAASAMGVPLMRVKTMAYVIGAFIGGVAGGFYAVYKGSTFPADFYLNVSIFILCMVILGGMGNVWGVTLGAMFLSWLNFEGLARIGTEFNETAGTSIDVPKYQFLVFGVIIVATMLFRPQGLIPSQRRQAEFEYAGRGGRDGSDRSMSTPDAGDPLVVTRKLRMEFGGLVACNDVDFTVPRGSIVALDRPERRRQDDLLQHDHRRLHADRGRGHLRRSRDRRGCRRTA